MGLLLTHVLLTHARAVDPRNVLLTSTKGQPCKVHFWTTVVSIVSEKCRGPAAAIELDVCYKGLQD